MTPTQKQMTVLPHGLTMRAIAEETRNVSNHIGAYAEGGENLAAAFKVFGERLDDAADEIDRALSPESDTRAAPAADREKALGADRHGRLPNGALLICRESDAVCRRQCVPGECKLEIEAPGAEPASGGDGREADERSRSQGTRGKDMSDAELDVIGRQRGHIQVLEDRVSMLEATLCLIRDWRMPRPYYAVDNGSNGERDYMRRAAQRALEWKP